MYFLEKLKPLGWLVLRCALGLVFVYHGVPKLFGKSQLYVDFFARTGLPPYLVYVAGVVELFGGALLIFGLFTRVAGVLLAGEMAVAIWKVHMAEGILAVSEYEYQLTLAAAAFALATTGAGPLSLDRLIFKDKT